MKIHEYNEMMAYLTRPASRQPVVQGGVIGEGGMFQGEDMGHRTGFKKIQYSPKYGKYKARVGKAIKGRPAKIIYQETGETIPEFTKRVVEMGKKGQSKRIVEFTDDIIELRNEINSWTSNWLNDNLSKYKVRDFETMMKDLKKDWKKARKTLNIDQYKAAATKKMKTTTESGMPNLSTTKGKKSAVSKNPFIYNEVTFYNPENPGDMEKYRAQWKRIFYKNKIETTPGLREKIKNHFDYINEDKRGKYRPGYSSRGVYKPDKDVIYLLSEQDSGLQKNARKLVFNSFDDLAKPYNDFVIKMNSSNWMAHANTIEKALGKEKNSIMRGMVAEQKALKKILDVSSLKKTGLEYSIDHGQGLAAAARSGNVNLMKTALTDLIGTTKALNTHTGFSGFETIRGALIRDIEAGINVENNIKELNKLTKDAYKELNIKGDIYSIKDGRLTSRPISTVTTQTGRFAQYFSKLKETEKGAALIKERYGNFNNLIKNLLQNASTEDIMQIRKVLDCPALKSSGGRIGFAPGGNLLDCPMKKLAENPEAVLNKVGQEIPETRTPIMNAFKKLGTPLKWAGNTFNVGLGPTGVVGLNYFLGVDPTETSGRIGLEAEVAFAKPLVEGAKSVTDKIKTPFLRKAAETAAGIRIPGIMTPANALRLARIASPIGWAALGLEGAYHGGKYMLERKKLLESLTDEQRDELLRKEKQEAVMQQKRGDPEAFDYLAAAEGGRVGFNEGSKPKSPSKRLFLKGLGALAVLPVVGKFFKLGKVLEKGSTYTGPTIEKIKGMPEWFPTLVKKLYNEGEDVTKQMSFKDRQIVKRGELEGGDEVDMYYDLDTGDVSIQVAPKKGKYETSSGAYNKEYELDYKKGQADETTKGKKPPDEFGVNEIKGRTDPEAMDIDWDINETTVDEAMSDLTELEAFAKNKTTKQIHKKKGTKKKDVFPDYDY